MNRRARQAIVRNNVLAIVQRMGVRPASRGVMIEGAAGQLRREAWVIVEGEQSAVRRTLVELFGEPTSQPTSARMVWAVGTDKTIVVVPSITVPTHMTISFKEYTA